MVHHLANAKLIRRLFCRGDPFLPRLRKKGGIRLLLPSKEIELKELKARPYVASDPIVKRASVSNRWIEVESG